MDKTVYFIYLAIMAISTYLIRALPFALVKHQIENRFVKSFLHYIPYTVLSAMTVPAIFTATGSIWSAAAGFATAVILSIRKKGLLTVALAACAAVYIIELII